MKRWISLLIIYVLVHSATGDSARTYEGLTQGQITSVLVQEGKTGDFITQQDFDAFVLAHALPVLTPTQIIASQRSGAVDELNAGTASTTKLQRAVFLVTLDEINLLRSLLVPTQPARTVAQFKNAVQQKINSGAAD